MGLIVFIAVLAVIAVVAAVLGLKLRKSERTEADSRAGSLVSFLAAGGVTFVAVLILVFSAVKEVPEGKVAVAKLFGEVVDEPFYPGLHFTNPLYAWQEFSIRRMTISANTSGNLKVLSNDNTPLDVQVSFPFSLNPKYAPKLYTIYGPPEAYAQHLMQKSARDALRNATSQFSWQEATAGNTEAYRTALQQEFRSSLLKDLRGAGFGDGEAEKVFTTLPAKLQKALPPEKVQNSIAEKNAAEEDLKRQKTLTKIAKEEAERRANEGQGVKNLLDPMPLDEDDYTANGIQKLLRAMAEKEKARALMKAVESGNVNVMVMDGGAAPAASVPRSNTSANGNQ